MVKYRNTIISIILSIVCIIMVAGCGSSKTPPTTPPKETSIKETNNKGTHIYDNAKVVDLKNGMGTATIGKVSVLKIKSSELTQSALEDWYFNYASRNVGDKGEKWNWAVIVYTDINNLGTFYNGTLIKDVKIKKDSKDDTWALDSDKGQMLAPDKDNKHLISLEKAIEDAEANRKKEQEAMIATNSSNDIDVQMSHQIEKISDKKYKVSGTTNLPEKTQLLITLSSDSYRGQGKCSVNNSKFEVVFSGEKLTPSDYDLQITMPIVRVQNNPEVAAKLGGHGEYLKGEYAVPSSVTNDIVVKYEVEVSLD